MTLQDNTMTLQEFLQAFRIADPTVTPAEIEKAHIAYARSILMLNRYVPEDHTGKEIHLHFAGFRSAGHQRIAEGDVSDRTIQHTESYNFYLQNTSQWVFAFGLVWDTERREFSTHT